MAEGDLNNFIRILGTQKEKKAAATASSALFLALRLTIRRFVHFLFSCRSYSGAVPHLTSTRWAFLSKFQAAKFASTWQHCISNQTCIDSNVRQWFIVCVSRYADVLSFERNTFIWAFFRRREFISFCLDWNMKSQPPIENGAQFPRALIANHFDCPKSLLRYPLLPANSACKNWHPPKNTDFWLCIQNKRRCRIMRVVPYLHFVVHQFSVVPVHSLKTNSRDDNSGPTWLQLHWSCRVHFNRSQLVFYWWIQFEWDLNAFAEQHSAYVKRLNNTLASHYRK